MLFGIDLLLVFGDLLFDVARVDRDVDREADLARALRRGESGAVMSYQTEKYGFPFTRGL